MTFKELIKSRGFTQRSLAEASNVNLRQISRVSTGSSRLSNLTAENFLSITKALSIDPYELLELDPPDTAP